MPGRGVVSLLVLPALAGLLVQVSIAQQLDKIVFLPDTLGSLSEPVEILPNPVSGKAYVVNEYYGAGIFDPATLRKTRFIADGLLIGAEVCPELEKVYLLSEDPGQLTVIDGRADTVLEYVELPAGAQAPLDLAFSPTSRKLYVGDDELGLVVLDAVSDTILRILDRVEYAHDLVWDSAHNRILAATWESTVVAVDCTTDSVDAVIGLPAGAEVPALNPGRGKLYVGAEDSIHIISTELLQQIGSVAVSGVLARLMHNPVYDRVYAVGVSPDEEECLAVIDCSADTVRAILPLQGTEDVYDLSFSPVTGHVYVGQESPLGVSIVDRGDTLAGLLFDGNRHDIRALGTCAARDELYCVMETDTIAVVDLRADTVTGYVDYTNFRVRGMAFNPAGRRLYLLSSTQDAVLVMNPEDSAIGRIEIPSLDANAFPILHPGLNRLYIHDDNWLHVIDCNTDVLTATHGANGLDEAIPVLVQEENMLYLFPENASSTARAIWVYDCLSDEILDTIPLGQETPCAVYHPRSDRIYFAASSYPGVLVFDPSSRTVCDTIPLAQYSSDGRMSADTRLNRVYFANERAGRLYTIDVTTDSIVDSLALPVALDTIIWSRTQSKLYLCRFSASTGRTYVFDCLANAITDSFPDTTAYCALLNERTERLYLGTDYGITVVDTRNDSVIVRLPEITQPRFAVCDMAANRVFIGRRSSWYVVYRDEPIGIMEKRPGTSGFEFGVLTNPARFRAGIRYVIPPGQVARIQFFDAAGRRVMNRMVQGNARALVLPWDCRDEQGRRVPAGVYLARMEVPGFSKTAKLVIQR